MILNTDPKKLEIIEEKKVKLIWKDDHESVYDAFRLRILCPCAECRGGHGGKIGDNTYHIKPPITISGYNKVGRYALMFDFSDFHKHGIYAFDFLREICPCEVCKEDAINNFKKE